MQVGQASVDIVADGRRFRRQVEADVAAASRETVDIQLRVDAQGRLRDQFGRFVKQAGQEGNRAGGAFSQRFGGAFSLKGVTSALSSLGQISLRGLSFAAVGASAAAAAASVVQFTAALAPAVGILGTLPSAVGIAAAGIATLRVALAGTGEAFGAALGDDAAAFEESLQGLAPAAQDTARALQALAPQFDELQQAVQQEFFTGLDQTLTDVASTLLGPVQQGMSGAAGAVGGLVQALGEVAASSAGVEFIEGSFAGLQTIVENLTDPLSSLFSALLEVGNAINEAFGADVGSGLAGMIQQFADFLSQAAASGDAVGWVESAITVFQQLGAILDPIIGIFASIGTAAQETGGNVLGVLGELLSGVDQFLSSAEGMDFLSELFNVLGSLGDALLPIIQAVGGALAAIAPSIADLLTTLGPGVETLVNALGEGLGALAPSLVPLGEALVSIVDAAAPLLPMLGELLGVLVTAGAGILSALSPLVTAGTSLIQAVLEPLLPFLDDWADIMTAALAPAIESVSDVLASLGPFLGDLVSTLADTLLPLFERWATEILPQLLPPLLELIQALVDALLPTLDALLPVFAQLIEAVGEAFLDAVVALLPLIVSLVEILSTTLEVLTPLIVAITELAGWLLGGLIDGLSAVIGWVIDLVGWFSDLLAGIVDFTTDAINEVDSWVSSIGDAFSGIKDWIDDVVDWFAELPDRILGALRDIGEEIGLGLGLGDLKDEIANAQGFANGGVVRRDGIVRVAEGNRPEVIIPLTRPRRAQQLADQSGLTGMLAGGKRGGGGGDITINIHSKTISPDILQERVERALAEALG